MDRRQVAAFGLVVVGGVISVRIGWPAFEARLALLMLATGWLVAGAGLLAWHRSPGSRIGPLVVLAAGAWFVGGFAAVRWLPLAELARALDLAFAAVVVHAVATHPTGRVRWVPVGGAIGAAYLAAVAPVARPDVAVAVVGLVTIAVARASPLGRGRPSRRTVAAGAVFLLLLAVGPSLPGWLGWSARFDGRVLQPVAFVVAGVVLCAPLVSTAGRIARLDALTIDLAVSPSQDVLAQLGRLLDDPAVQLGTWAGDAAGYVDLEGRPIALPSPGSGRIALDLGIPGTHGPILVHDAGTVVDLPTRLVIGRALGAAAAHALVQASLREQVLAVRRSRDRLLLAGDVERSEIERELNADLDPRFARLLAEMDASELTEEPDVVPILAEVAATREELAGLVRGAGMPDVALGLPEALGVLAARLPVAVEVEVSAESVPPRTAETVLFVASEALTNVVKHARADRASVRVRPGLGGLDLEVTDEGIGGADPTLGSGLLGLRDRVEALGGRLTIVSRPGAGTRVLVNLPIRSTGP
jgi:hypothetical protein